MAGYLISLSFESWGDSPIKTTINTRPISEIKFPKVTVCPPRNTFTDLNYDLMLVENMTLTEEKQNDMADKFDEILNEHVFMMDFNKLREYDRYYNWYHGLSDLKIENDQLRLLTSASSGIITTYSFGENFDPNKVEKKSYLQVTLLFPSNIAQDKNITLHFNVEKVSLTDLPSTGQDFIGIRNGRTSAKIFDPDENKFFRNYTPPIPIPPRTLYTSRIVSDEDLLLVTNKKMPGFNFSWHCSGENFKKQQEPTGRFTDSPFNRKVKLICLLGTNFLEQLHTTKNFFQFH